jgi:hypothetical protein
MYVNPYLKESEDLYLNSRQRFEAACRHSPSDRPPVDYLAGRTLDERLRRHLGLSTETELLDVLGADLY